jgi:hypothetical protein
MNNEELKLMNGKILYWFANGKVGASARVMASVAAGIDQEDKCHPLDPDDLNRCLLLLKSVPEIRHHFDKISAVSEKWERLIKRWDEVENCFLNEVGLNWVLGDRAPKTYRLMQEVYSRYQPGQ